MKKVVYESFIWCHVTYCLIAWGAKKSIDRANLVKQINKSWLKIGKKYQHTHNRLKEHSLFKLEDEIRMQEAKLIWKWEKKKIPKGLNGILTEENTRRLRSRKFTRKPKWKQNSISFRLATRAMKEIDEISCARSKLGLKRKFKKIIQLNYNTDCSNRNCFICTRGQVRTL